MRHLFAVEMLANLRKMGYEFSDLKDADIDDGGEEERCLNKSQEQEGGSSDDSNRTEQPKQEKVGWLEARLSVHSRAYSIVFRSHLHVITSARRLPPAQLATASLPPIPSRRGRQCSRMLCRRRAARRSRRRGTAERRSTSTSRRDDGPVCCLLSDRLSTVLVEYRWNKARDRELLATSGLIQHT